MQLQGKLLIAMPAMGDPRFARSVVLICAHSEGGAMGLIVNRPAPDLSFGRLLDQLGIDRGDKMRDIRVHIGGPVESSRGFVLHSGDYATAESTLKVDDRFGMTATLDILSALAEGQGPESSFLALGYAGWGPGQLESEIADNGWLVADADPDLVFSGENPAKWRKALSSLGIDPLLLSPEAGHA